MQRPGAASKAGPRVPLEIEELMGCRLHSWLGGREKGETRSQSRTSARTQRASEKGKWARDVRGPARGSLVPGT